MSYEMRTDGKQNGRNEVCRVNTKQKSITTICTNEWKIYPMSAQTVTGILIKKQVGLSKLIERREKNRKRKRWSGYGQTIYVSI